MFQHLFHQLEIEANKKILFEKNVFDVVIGQGAFFQQPAYVKTILRKEHILLSGKTRVIRRVYCRCDGLLEYQNIGWVLFTDVQNCMVVSDRSFTSLLTAKLAFN